MELLGWQQVYSRSWFNLTSSRRARGQWLLMVYSLLYINVSHVCLNQGLELLHGWVDKKIHAGFLKLCTSWFHGPMFESWNISGTWMTLHAHTDWDKKNFRCWFDVVILVVIYLGGSWPPSGVGVGFHCIVLKGWHKESQRPVHSPWGYIKIQIVHIQPIGFQELAEAFNFCNSYL